MTVCSVTSYILSARRRRGECMEGGSGSGFSLVYKGKERVGTSKKMKHRIAYLYTG